MAEIASTPPVSEETYRPISGLAIVGLGLGVLSFSIFLLNSPWLLPFLPVPGLIFSFLARRRIRESEGTLAGYHLAGLGAATSLVALLVYLTMHSTEYWFIRSESKDFLDRWLQKVREGKEGLAFLDTVPPEQRHITFSPADLRKVRAHFPTPGNPDGSLYDGFRSAPMTSAMFRYRDRFEWKYVSMESMSYNLGSYDVKQRYWISTPEVSGEVIFHLVSGLTKGPSGDRREWRLNINASEFASNPPPQATDYGAELLEAQGEASRFMRSWAKAVSEGNRTAAEALLRGQSDRELQANHRQLYDVLRQGVQPQDTIPLSQKETYLTYDTKEGNSWVLQYAGVLDVGTREVEISFRVETDDLRKGLDGWRITRIKSLGERKKMPIDPSVGALGAGGGMPTPPKK
jgi:hypothetical protein